jgi:glycosyltransferase involved in cell wall biosynthesis
VEDLAGALGGARVAIAPMRYGAGLKLKTVEAMAHGVPVVSTTLGAEGLGASNGAALLVADDSRDIAEHLTALLADDHLWRKISEGGLAHVRERYAADVIVPRLEELLAVSSRGRT